MTGSTNFRGLYPVIVRRSNAQSMLHGFFLRLFEGSIDSICRTHKKATGKGPSKTGIIWIQCLLSFSDASVGEVILIPIGIRLTQYHVMAGSAGNSIPGQGAIVRVFRIAKWRCTNDVPGKILTFLGFLKFVNLKLSLAQYSMTSKTSGFYKIPGVFVKGLHLTRHL